MLNPNNEILLTTEGLEKLEAELEELKVVKRQEIAERIKEARTFGDISENAEYDEAKNAQAELELRIDKLEHILKFAVVVDENNVPTGIVYVGSTVKVQNLTDDEEETFEIVGAREADPFRGKISHVSPIGSALMGKKKGDTVEAHTPSGTIEFKVLSIKK